MASEDNGAEVTIANVTEFVEEFTQSQDDQWSVAVTRSGRQGAAWLPYQLSPAYRTYAICVAVLGVAGIFSNGVTLMVFFRLRQLKKKSLTLASKLILQQTVLDFLTSLVMVVEFAVRASQRVKYLGTLGRLFCVIIGANSALWFGLNFSTIHLVLITLERYMRVVFPVFHRNYISYHKMAVAMAVSGCLVFLWTTTFTVYGSRVLPSGLCQSMITWPNEATRLSYGLGSFVLFFALPLFIFCFCYTHMLITRCHKKKSQPASSEVSGNEPMSNPKHKLSQTQMNITKVMLMVCVGFIVCWSPIQIMFLLFNVDLVFEGYIYFSNALTCLAFLNCCVNPVIYAAKLEEFKLGLKLLFGKNAAQVVPASSAATTSTIAH